MTKLEQTASVHEESGNNINVPKETSKVSEAASNNTNVLRDIYDIPEAAYRMHMGVRTLRGIIERNGIRYVRFNRRIYLREKDCAAFLAEHVV